MHISVKTKHGETLIDFSRITAIETHQKQVFILTDKEVIEVNHSVVDIVKALSEASPFDINEAGVIKI